VVKLKQIFKGQTMHTIKQLRTNALLRATVATSCLLMANASFAETVAVAGVVKKKEGTVEIVRGGKTIVAEVGTTIEAGDLVKTAKDSSVGIMLKDETRMSVGPASQMALDRYSFNADTYAGGILVNVIKGTFAMISGLVVKNNPVNSQIKTPTSTAGIRGTSFVVEVP
jgi:hypothetical protein